MAVVPLATKYVWHHWLAFFLAISVLPVMLAIIIGYLVKVVAPKYGRR